MVHAEIYKCLQKCVPIFSDKIKTYFPSGKNCIRIRQTDGQEYIFTYNGPQMWRIETVGQFLAGMKGEKHE